MERKIISFDKVKINYSITRKSKRFIVLLHGAGEDLNAWKKERKFLHSKGHSTIAVDIRGHGKSDDPQFVKDYALSKSATDIFCILKAEKIANFILVGYCLGGMIAIEFHRQYPHFAKAYVLVDTYYKVPENVSKIFKSNKKLLNFLDQKLSKHKGFVEKKYRNYNNFMKTPNFDLARVYQDITTMGLKAWTFTFQNIVKFNGLKTLKSIRQKILIVVGEKDTLFGPSAAHRMHLFARNSQLKILPNTNHISVINNPKQLGLEIQKFADSIYH